MASLRHKIPLARWAVVLVPGSLLYFLPIGQFPAESRHLLAIFLATVLALIARPAPMGMAVFISMTLLASTRTLSLPRALSGFSSPTVWLIFSAFLFAQAVTHTQLGVRIAYLSINHLARSPLTLGYAAAASNLVLAPLVPSETARGGIVAPILRNVAQALGSEPGATASRSGSYLMLVGFHTNYLASLLFLTSMAGNPLIAKFAMDTAHVELSWARWALAASVPGLVSFALMPWLIHSLAPPSLRDTSHAQRFAQEKLRAMGPTSPPEKLLLLILGAVILGWVTSPWHKVDNTIVAMGGVCLILLTRVVSWEDLIGNAKAWDVLVWFGPLLMMADELVRQGVMSELFSAGFSRLQGLPWALSLATLALCYFFAHYAFASLTAQISALYSGFLGAALVVGVPAPLAAWTLAFLSNLNAGLTHYGAGSAPLYFAGGYVSQAEWWSVGFVVALINLAVWLGIGSLWWNLTGLW